MATRDLIERTLSGPLDWSVFESVVFEILIGDDLPRLRKVGGRADGGMDAVQEAFYQDESSIETVVQVTSEKTQVAKLKKTLQRLKKEDTSFSNLVVVYQHPVSSTVRREMQAEAKAQVVSIDIRDQSYLVARLGRENSTIFARYFGSPKEQLAKLLAHDDPLRVTESREQKALLATLGAFVVADHAPLARRTLFQKTVLATLSAQNAPVDIERLTAAVQTVLPEPIQADRVLAAVDALQKTGEVLPTGGGFEASQDAISKAALVTLSGQKAYDDLLVNVVGACSKIHRIDNATEGILERNIRHALLDLFRAFGPLSASDSPKQVDEHTADTLLRRLSRDVPGAVGKTALTALAGYVENAANWAALAPFGRAYCALALWNLDPQGRRWQREAMSRSILALDTDAILSLIIDDLPDCAAIRRAAKALADAGVELVVSDQVAKEVIHSLAIADTTYRRFETSLLRMSPAMVTGNVWHALVRGYYYAKKAGFEGDWQAYKARYFIEHDARSYLLHLLSRIASIRETALNEIPNEWHDDLLALAEHVLKRKEQSRLKAAFRDASQMADRARYDVEMALHLAVDQQGPFGPNARGYLVSEDRAFEFIQNLPEWRDRHHVHTYTRALPELAEYSCGIALDDADVVRFLFDPVIRASANLMGDEIQSLASLGVDLSQTFLPKLEFDLRNGLHDRLLKAGASREGNEAESVFDVLSDARAKGYRLEPRVAQWIDKAEEIQENALIAQERSAKLEAALVQVALVTAGDSRKGRTRARAALKELGIDLDKVLGPQGHGDAAESGGQGGAQPT